ncbi:MAG TPA: hypothetical protein VH085_09490 [Nocardioides sp.]|nr:hypothetical protein [Nocardioides sp.]
MRLLTTSVALLVASGGVLSVPVVAQADTGGSRLYYIGSTGMWSAPAASPGHRVRVPKPHESDGPVYPEAVVPSPTGSRLAISMHLRRNSGQRIYLTGPRGQHPVRVARFDNDPDVGQQASIDGLSWKGQHRLYFSLVSGTSIVIDTVRVPTHGKPGPVREVPNSAGLYGVTVDPRSNMLAGVQTVGMTCSGSGSVTTLSAYIVTLNLTTHQRRRLAPVRTPDPAVCGAPGNLAWSPDGSKIAFAGLAYTRQAPKLLIRVLETVATGRHQSHRPQPVTPPRRKLTVTTGPAWQSAHSLWFGADQDLFQVGLDHGQVSPPHRKTHNPSALKSRISFG